MLNLVRLPQERTVNRVGKQTVTLRDGERDATNEMREGKKRERKSLSVRFSA